jgi:valyl-tRNA synthetase
VSEPTSVSGGYDPAKIEDRWYRFWTERQDFTADPSGSAPPFCIVIPPPNVTGVLHTGHALDNTLQDILVRFHRMRGFNTLWIPGTDHAGIATQTVVERELAKEGKTRHDLGRDAFVAQVWQWKARSGSRIFEQLKRLGASADWTRARFTMDEGLSRAVREVFVRLHKEGLIYRAERLINWDPDALTALSDLEVENEQDFQTELWSFAYPLAEPVQGPDGGTTREIIVATTRPETMLGDSAVAVHPDDPRYRHLLGKSVRHPILDREIPIVGDAVLVDPKFGTGAVKVTPAHDFNDFACGKRNGLELVSILNPDGTINANGGPFEGLDRFEARKAVKQRIADLGLERGSRPHTMALPRSQRSKAIVEPMLSTQWFCSMKSLAEPAIEAVRSKRVELLPESWEATYFHWMENIQDWCISRQLWWGHRIPAWYCMSGHLTVAREDPEQCGTCGSSQLEQDPDVLDTWFSSWLWPFSTMGWPERTPDLQRWYPTSVLVTGFDILFFWVARMIMAGLHFMGEVPFRRVFLHALLRDAQGRKISKSLGNALDPVELMDKYGADAVRFTLAILTIQGRDMLLDEKRIEGYRFFVNKLYNAVRFVRMNLPEDARAPREAEPAELKLADRWILGRLRRAIVESTEGITDGHFNQYCSAMYGFVWHELCDWYLETVKTRLGGEDLRDREVAQATLLRVLDAALRLLHPVTPFVTEELASHLPVQHKPLVQAPWPAAEDYAADAEAERDMGTLMEVVRAVRNVRGELNVPPGAKVEVHYRAEDPQAASVIEAERASVLALCRASGLHPLAEARPPHAALAAGPGFELAIPLEGLLDIPKELARLGKAREKAEKDAAMHEKKLGNPKFVQSAPAEVVEQAREKLRLAQEELASAARALRRIEEMARS